MAEIRLKCGALFASRRIRASATVSVSLVIESPPPAVSAEVQRHRAATETADHPELRARWHALPEAVRPQDWVTGTGSTHVPGSLLIAEAQRPPEGYYPAAG